MSGQPRGRRRWTSAHLGGLHAMTVSSSSPARCWPSSNAVFEELGPTLNAATSHNEAVMELLAGDPAAAETTPARRVRRARGDGRAGLPLDHRRVPRAGGLAQGRDEEARRSPRSAQSSQPSDDRATQLIWRNDWPRSSPPRAGREAEELARRGGADQRSRQTSSTCGPTLSIDLAAILHQAGLQEEANTAAAEALDLYEQKGNTCRGEEGRTSRLPNWSILPSGVRRSLRCTSR